MAKQWIDRQYINTYHPSTSTPVNPIHAQAAKGAVVGAVGGAMDAAVRCGITPQCLGAGAAKGALTGAQVVYTHNAFFGK